MAVPASRLGEASGLPCGLARPATNHPDRRAQVWRKLGGLAITSPSQLFTWPPATSIGAGRGDHRRHLKLRWITWLNPQ